MRYFDPPSEMDAKDLRPSFLMTYRNGFAEYLVASHPSKDMTWNGRVRVVFDALPVQGPPRIIRIRLPRKEICTLLGRISLGHLSILRRQIIEDAHLAGSPPDIAAALGMKDREMWRQLRLAYRCLVGVHNTLQTLHPYAIAGHKDPRTTTQLEKLSFDVKHTVEGWCDRLMKYQEDNA